MAKVSQPPVNDVVDDEETYDPFRVHTHDTPTIASRGTPTVKLPKIVY